jgi:hypothetical protein
MSTNDPLDAEDHETRFIIQELGIGTQLALLGEATGQLYSGV